MNLLNKFSQNKPMQFHLAPILLRKVKLWIEEKNDEAFYYDFCVYVFVNNLTEH